MTTEELCRHLTDGPGGAPDGGHEAWDGGDAWNCGSGADGERRPWDCRRPRTVTPAACEPRGP
jgi:hypothetical protein